MSDFKEENRYKLCDEDYPVFDVTNISDRSLDFVNRTNASHKVSAMKKVSAIEAHNLTTLAGIICQDRIERAIAYCAMQNPNPGSVRRLEELAMANVLFIREHIYDPGKGGGYQ